jgi:thiosulfate dehydrogenase
MIFVLIAPPGFAAGPASIPSGPLGDAIRLGRDIVQDTQHYARNYVGNGLNCASCHQNAGAKPGALPLTGLYGQFPSYSPRSGKVITLEDRINSCFLRSMNGKALPTTGREMMATVAYVAWLSRGYAVGVEPPGRGTPKLALNTLKPDRTNGKREYETQCAACHGADGAGTYDSGGNPMYPALWGDKSFNIGAGMARLYTAASFVKANMPLNAPATLSAQEALDVAAYFTTQPRPDYAGKINDWPGGRKPPDARY